MKFLLIVLLFLTQGVKANELPSLSFQEFVHLIPLWEVLPNSPQDVVGDNGRAYGYYQITPIMVADFNRISGKNYTHEDCFNYQKSKEIATVVLAHYAKHIQSKGITLKVDHLLFIWNGGGGAWRRVEYPIKDMKQLRLERYRDRAMYFIYTYLKNFRTNPSKAMPLARDNIKADEEEVHLTKLNNNP